MLSKKLRTVKLTFLLLSVDKTNIALHFWCKDFFFNFFLINLFDFYCFYKTEDKVLEKIKSSTYTTIIKHCYINIIKIKTRRTKQHFRNN